MPTVPFHLPLTHCPECGYRMDGLPTHGKCPECGASYDEQTISLWGWAAGAHANLANTHYSGKLARAAVLIAVLLLTLVWFLQADYLCVIASLCVAIIPAIYTFWKNNSGFNPPPKPTQLLITSHGIGQRDGFGPLKVCPWNIPLEIETQILRPNLFRLRATHETDIGDVETRPADFVLSLPQEQFDNLMETIIALALPAGGRIGRIL